jgi:hypothetical protein
VIAARGGRRLLCMAATGLMCLAAVDDAIITISFAAATCSEANNAEVAAEAAETAEGTTVDEKEGAAAEEVGDRLVGAEEEGMEVDGGQGRNTAFGTPGS